MRALSILVVVAILAVVPSTSSAEDGATCQGHRPRWCSCRGIVQGTDGDDVIIGGARTKVRGHDGRDTICVTAAGPWGRWA